MNEKLFKSRGRDGAPVQSGDAFTLIGGAARVRSRAGRKGWSPCIRQMMAFRNALEFLAP